ncbi:MAG: hypothetical protein DBX42_08850 [Azospirillum sp.]|nr:MAG: hypothetical protein DBX42_08850 [Azospirillum sp.]
MFVSFLGVFRNIFFSGHASIFTFSVAFRYLFFQSHSGLTGMSEQKGVFVLMGLSLLFWPLPGLLPCFPI